jgi:hypothetical protein
MHFVGAMWFQSSKGFVDEKPQYASRQGLSVCSGSILGGFDERGRALSQSGLNTKVNPEALWII